MDAKHSPEANGPLSNLSFRLTCLRLPVVRRKCHILVTSVCPITMTLIHSASLVRFIKFFKDSMFWNSKNVFIAPFLAKYDDEPWWNWEKYDGTVVNKFQLIKAQPTISFLHILEICKAISYFVYLISSGINIFGNKYDTFINWTLDYANLCFTFVLCE